MGSIFQLSKDLRCCLGNKGFPTWQAMTRILFSISYMRHCKYIQHCRVTTPLSLPRQFLFFNSGVIINGAPFTPWSAPVINMVSHLEQWFLTPASTLEEPWIVKKNYLDTSVLAVACGFFAVLCGIFSCSTWTLWLWSPDSVVVGHDGLSYCLACGILGSNPHPLNWMVILHQWTTREVSEYLKKV